MYGIKAIFKAGKNNKTNNFQTLFFKKIRVYPKERR